MHYEGAELPPEPAGSDDQVHERVVRRPPDVTRAGRIVLQTGGGSDTGWRQVFPLTYDFPLDHPEAVRSAEDDD